MQRSKLKMILAILALFTLGTAAAQKVRNWTEAGRGDIQDFKTARKQGDSLRAPPVGGYAWAAFQLPLPEERIVEFEKLFRIKILSIHGRDGKAVVYTTRFDENLEALKDKIFAWNPDFLNFMVIRAVDKVHAIIAGRA